MVGQLAGTVATANHFKSSPPNQPITTLITVTLVTHSLETDFAKS